MKYADLQSDRIARGLCAYCGEEALLSRRAGRKCLAKRRDQQRARTGRSQDTSGRGRPALT